MPIALWLEPAPDDARTLQVAIDSLAARYGVAPFAPHVTVLAAFEAEPAALERSLAEVAAGTRPFALDVLGIGHTPAFFQTLFLDFGLAEPVLSLRRQLAPLLGRKPEDAALPHLSLLYAHLEEPERAALAEEIAVPPRVRFDALSWVTPGPGRTDWLDVAGWQRGARVRLGGG